jgi:hypothetical protein
MKRAIAGIVIVASVVSLPALGKPRIEGPTVLEASSDPVVAWFGASERGCIGEMTNVARRLATSGLIDPEETTSASGPKIETGFAEVNGTRLYYEVAGTGDPIVLIHGNFGDRRYYDGQFEALARLHRVLRYDIRGYGKSILRPGLWQVDAAGRRGSLQRLRGSRGSDGASRHRSRSHRRFLDG